jgi:hypothetical protein
MDDRAYHLTTHWRVPGTCGEVADVLGEPDLLPQWWPSVYLKVDELAPPEADGTGRRVALLTKGWLPYTLRWDLVVVESNYPYGMTIAASGDLSGRGVWSFSQDGAFVDVTYDWNVRAEKPLLRKFSALLKPLFAANHRWAMAQGEESLRLELARRRTTSDAERAAIPPPAGPITYAGALLVAGSGAAAVGIVYLVVKAFGSADQPVRRDDRKRRRRRRRRH